MADYTTWDPANKSADITLSNGNLTATLGPEGYACARSVLGVSSGKWYWEITFDDEGPAYNLEQIGVGDNAIGLDFALGYYSTGYAYREDGQKANNNSYVAFGSIYNVGDIVSIALDMDAGKIWWALNGVWQASGDPGAGTNEAYSGISGVNYAYIMLHDNTAAVIANFGASAFSHSVPSGFNSGLYEVFEITLPSPFLSTTSLQSNIQVELVPGALSAEASMLIGESFWGTFVSLPSPFAATASLQANAELDIAISPFVSQSNLQGNIQIEIVPPAFASQNELSISEIWYGILITLPNPFSANASLQANTQIELVAAPLLATSELLSNVGIEVSAGILNTTGAIQATPVYPIILTGAKRIYLFTLTGVIDGVEDIIIPISSFQSRAKSVGWGSLKMYSLGTSYVVINWVSNITYLSVVIPGLEYAADINDRLNGDLVIRMGYKKDDEILLSEIAINVTFENIRIDEGATNKSITLDGHGYDIIHELQELNLAGASYKSLDGSNLRYRCAPNLYLRPGDTATINGDSFTVKSIVRSVSPELETYEISE